MIDIQNLSKIYRSTGIETIALNQFNFQVRVGEFVAIMGPSGCGKSTLLHIIGLLDTFDKGDYYFNEQQMNDLDEKTRGTIRKKQIGFIFQNFNLIDELTVFENIELPLIYNKVGKKKRVSKVNQLLKDLDIEHRKKHFPQQLSGGQQQRVAVARALVTEPQLILADEPTGNLDSKNGNEVMELLADLHRQGSTIIMVTHSNYDAGFATRIIEVKDGQIMAERKNKREIRIIDK